MTKFDISQNQFYYMNRKFEQSKSGKMTWPDLAKFF